MRKSLVFDPNANPDRAAFQIAKPGMMHPEATTLRPAHQVRSPAADFLRLEVSKPGKNEADQESVSQVLFQSIRKSG
jgi:hypothetical protein